MTRYLPIGAALFCLASNSLFAQAQGILLGTVHDSSGAVISDVTVEIANIGTGATRTVRSNSEGGYIASNLPIGTYDVRGQKQGFNRVAVNNVVLGTDQQIRIDLTLTVGGLSTEVLVTGEVPLVSTDDSKLGGVITSNTVKDLPLNGRNFAQLAYLQPGVTTGLIGSSVPTLFGLGLGISSLGQRDIDNTFTLDGAPMHNLINNQPRFEPSIDAISEVSVETGIYSAEYGGQSGAQVNVATKSGTNTLHGALYDFLRNTAFDAHDFFSQHNTAVPVLRRNQFGGVLSGPVWVPKIYKGTNRTFFMFDYEGWRQTQSSPALAFFPTLAQRSGIFSTPITNPLTGAPFPGNTIPSNLITPQAQALLRFLPVPNLNTTTSANTAVTELSTDNSNQFFGRVDEQINSRYNLFVRYSYGTRTTDAPTGADLNTFNLIPTRSQNVVATLVGILKPQLINEFRLSYNRERFEWIGSGPGYAPGVAASLGIPGLTLNPQYQGVPALSISGFGGLSPVAAVEHLVDDISTLDDTLSWNHGTHFVKFGTDINLTRTNFSAVTTPTGSLSFTGVATGNAFADFLLGYPYSSSNGAGPEGQAETLVYLRQWRANFFVTDDWKATRRLTINIGLRYELDTVVTDKGGHLRSVNLADDSLFPGVNVKEGLYKPDHKNFAPRLGLAYRPFNDNKTVIRAGAGIFYNTPILNTLSVLAGNPPYSLTATYTTNTTAPNLLLSNPFPTGLGQLPTVYSLTGVDPNYRPGYTSEWMTNVQRQLFNSWLVEVGYTGSESAHLDRYLYKNEPYTPGPGSLQALRPNPGVGTIRWISTDSNSDYNALLARLQKQVSKSSTVLVSYAFSRDLGYGYSANISNISPQNYYDLSHERGLLPQFRKHQLSGSFTYGLPLLGHSNALLRGVAGGWQFNGIITLNTGAPFTVTTTGSPLNNGGTARPNRTCDGGLPSGNRSPEYWFQTSCFVAAPLYTYGDSGQGILIAPGVSDVDLSIFKHFSFRDRYRIDLRIEAFNALNTPNLSTPGSTLGTATFGEITSTKGPNREMQMALKYVF